MVGLAAYRRGSGIAFRQRPQHAVGVGEVAAELGEAGSRSGEDCAVEHGMSGESPSGRSRGFSRGQAQKALDLGPHPLVGGVERSSLQKKLGEHRAVFIDQQQSGRRRPDGGAKRSLPGDEPWAKARGPACH